MIINCIPHKDKELPRITLLLSNSRDMGNNNKSSSQGGGNGTNGGTKSGTWGTGGGTGEASKDDTAAGGLTVRIKAEGFRLAGEWQMHENAMYQHP